MIEFLSANWLWLVFIGFFLAMHAGGHGCGMHGHGGHAGGQHEHERQSPGDEDRASVKESILERGAPDGPVR